MEQILKLSQTSRTFYPPLPKEILIDEFHFEFASYLKIAKSLIDLDPNLMKMHMKIGNKCKEEEFWGSYFYRCCCVRMEIGMDMESGEFGPSGVNYDLTLLDVIKDEEHLFQEQEILNGSITTRQNYLDNEDIEKEIYVDMKVDDKNDNSGIHTKPNENREGNAKNVNVSSTTKTTGTNNIDQELDLDLDDDELLKQLDLELDAMANTQSNLKKTENTSSSEKGQGQDRDNENDDEQNQEVLTNQDDDLAELEAELAKDLGEEWEV